MYGLPHLLDFVSPTWMLNRDPDPGKNATSWRLSLRACLIRLDVIRKAGFIDPQFCSVDAAGLDLGHRYIIRGAVLRNATWLSSTISPTSQAQLTLEDEVRFIVNRYGTFWAKWALVRAWMTKYITLHDVHDSLSGLKKICRYSEPSPLPPRTEKNLKSEGELVTVLIPTIHRYAYLRKLLDQLRQQTITPLEIIIVDQTPVATRDRKITQDFQDLPLRYFWLESPGQCSSRNLGLQETKGEYVLFLDDDDEVLPNLIESHLSSLKRFCADVSSGVAVEVGAGPLPTNFTFVRASDVFPTNNTLIRRSLLSQSGLFDLAYERGQRADGDLGMRIYLSGALMILNPEISVIHHHAPQGGLRTHKARVITYASSRQRITHRQIPSASEIYLARRYFTPEQVREMIWLRVLGTFAIRGDRLKKAAKIMVSALCLPITLFQIHKENEKSDAMLKKFPQIPKLHRLGAHEEVQPDENAYHLK
jgi:glycosyltransferase involved in cell wall biosynthesis